MMISPKVERILYKIGIAVILFIVLQIATFCFNQGDNEHYQPKGKAHDGVEPTIYD